MVAIFFNDTEPFEQFVDTFRQKAPGDIWGEIMKRFERRRRFLYMSIALGQGYKSLIATKKFSYFNHTL